MPDDIYARRPSRIDPPRVEPIALRSAAPPIPATADWGRGLAAALATPRGQLLCLVALFAAAFAIRLGLGLALPRYHHPDELFQYYEQAYRLAFGQGVVPWEYREGIRSWLLPGLLAGIMRIFEPIGGPEAYFVASRALWSVLSLTIIAVAFLWARRSAGLLAGAMAAAITASWFELVYFAPAALTESIATAPLFAAAWLGATARPDDRRRFLLIGVLLGAVFMVRFHLAPALLVVAVIACGRDLRRWQPLLLGGALPLAALALLDWATLGWPLQSVIKNFWVNIVEQRSHKYGVMPVSFYLEAYFWSWWLWCIPMLGLAWLGGRGRPMLWAVPVAIVLSHSLVGHKEYRFVLPALPFILAVAAIGTARLARWLSRRFDLSLAAVAVGLVLIWCGVSAALATRGGWMPEWQRSGPQIEATAALHHRADICGLGVFLSWGDFAGYVGMHRDVPVLWSPDPATLEGEREAFNYVLGPPEAPLAAAWGYALEECWGGNSCIWRRDGGCAPPQGHFISEVMRGLGD